MTIDTSIGSMIIPAIKDFVEKPNMRVRFYHNGNVNTIRGVAVDHFIAFYFTPDEFQKMVEETAEKQRLTKIEYFETMKEKMDKAFEELPVEFQNRIKRFRNNNPSYRYDYEAGELYVCREAVKIATALKTESEINRFRTMSVEAQRKLVGLDDGHSGNTIGCAALLAKLYVTKPELVEKIHGWACPIVGCQKYGCEPRKED
jgi:hypothetical protein